MAILRPVLRRALPFALALAACAVMGWYLLRHREQWQGMLIESPELVAFCGAACVVALLVPGRIFQLMTRQVGAAVGLGESTCLAVMTTAINTFVPLHAGVAARAVYLKKRHGLELSRFAATFLGYNILRLCAAASLACIAGLWLLWHRAGDPGLETAEAVNRATLGLQGLVVVSAALAAVAFGTCFVRPAWLGGVGFRGFARVSWLRPLFRLHEGWVELIRSPAFLVNVLGLVVLQVLAEVVMVWAAWNAVGARLSPVAALLVAAFGILTALTGLTPGGLGLVEVVSVAVGATVAVDPTHGIAAGLIARGVGLAILGVTAPLAFLWLARRSAAT